MGLARQKVLVAGGSQRKRQGYQRLAAPGRFYWANVAGERWILTTEDTEDTEVHRGKLANERLSPAVVVCEQFALLPL